MRVLNLVVIGSAIAMIFGCEKKIDDPEAVALVGRKVINRESFNAFQIMRRNYPESMGNLFPAGRVNVTAMAETEALFQKSNKNLKKDVEKSMDWQWKKMYFPAQLYMKRVISQQLGYTDAELKEYYEKNKENYRIEKNVEKESKNEEKTDESGSGGAEKEETVAEKQFKPFLSVKREVTGKMFLEENPPPVEMYEVNDGDKVDSSMVENRWLTKMSKTMPDFLMAKLYEKKYGEPFSDTLEAIYGEGKAVTESDVDVIMGWLPENSTLKDRKLILAKWLLKWKLFYEEAQRKGWDKEGDIGSVVEWARKYQIAGEYVSRILAPEIEGVTIDTSMVYYDYWDSHKRTSETPPSSAVERMVDKWLVEAKKMEMDKKILKIRNKVGIKFLQSDYKDIKGENPDDLMTEADSLVKAEKGSKAYTLYKKINNNFPFTEQGEKALLEMAKYKTEDQKYKNAVEFYRQHNILYDDRKCNNFFMIGFIFDEYLRQPEKAELNYKWILKNTPDCDLADDAEFMCLHLDEPTPGVETLREESLRQGKSVDEDETANE